MSPLLAELEELYRNADLLDALREKVKARDDKAVTLMLYFNIWKKVRETKGDFSPDQKARAMEDTLTKLQEKMNLVITYG